MSPITIMFGTFILFAKVSQNKITKKMLKAFETKAHLK